MRCSNCGNEISASEKFCAECGQKASHEKRTMQLTCKTCGGTLTVDSDRPVLVCPFCQSQELIDESDNVTIERIKNKTYKDVEFEKLRHEEAKEQRKIEHEKEKAKEAEAKKQAYVGNYGKMAKAGLFFSIICLIVAARCFGTSSSFGAGLLIGLQAILLFAAWFTGKKNSYNKTSTKHKLLALVGCLCFLLWPSVLNENNTVLMQTVEIPGITEASLTNESEGIYRFPVRNYIGKNAASIGKTDSYGRIDPYGNGEVRLVFIANDDIYVNPLSDEQLKEYVVYAQSLSGDDAIITVSDRYSSGEPASFTDYQNHEEILLYVVKIGENAPTAPETIAIMPSPDRRTYYIRDYVGRNAASIGRTSSSGRFDTYGHGELRLDFASATGEYVDVADINVLKQYIVIGQDIAPNTPMSYVYHKFGNGQEADFLEYQNHETITLTVQKLDESVIAQMPMIVPDATEAP